LSNFLLQNRKSPSYVYGDSFTANSTHSVVTEIQPDPPIAPATPLSEGAIKIVGQALEKVPPPQKPTVPITALRWHKAGVKNVLWEIRLHPRANNTFEGVLRWGVQPTAAEPSAGTGESFRFYISNPTVGERFMRQLIPLLERDGYIVQDQTTWEPHAPPSGLPNTPIQKLPNIPALPPTARSEIGTIATKGAPRALSGVTAKRKQPTPGVTTTGVATPMIIPPENGFLNSNTTVVNGRPLVNRADLTRGAPAGATTTRAVKGRSPMIATQVPTGGPIKQYIPPVNRTLTTANFPHTNTMPTPNTSVINTPTLPTTAPGILPAGAGMHITAQSSSSSTQPASITGSLLPQEYKTWT